MAKKQVYAALEIADREVRLVVLEVFDSRNNILRVEKVPCAGIDKTTIVNESAVVKAIQQAIRQAETALGYRIERVLLAIPGSDVIRSAQKIHITIEDGTKNIRLFHIQQGLAKAMQKKADEDHELININKITYVVNDIPTERIPVGMEAESFEMEVDLLYVDKVRLYAFARAVEQSNLEIIDVCLDVYAQARESAALGLSAERPIILLNLDDDHTSLVLAMQEKIMTAAEIDKGLRYFTSDLQTKFRLSDDISYRLLTNLFSSKEEDNKDVIIYIESQDGHNVEVTQSDLARLVLPKIREWIMDINEACAGIVKDGKARYMITGKGSNLVILEEMTGAFNAPASVYQVTAIGARDGAYTAGLGMSYVWQDMNRIKKDDRISVSRNELEESIETISRITRDEEGGFTQKLKRVILSNNS